MPDGRKADFDWRETAFRLRDRTPNRPLRGPSHYSQPETSPLRSTDFVRGGSRDAPASFCVWKALGRKKPKPETHDKDEYPEDRVREYDSENDP